MRLCSTWMRDAMEIAATHTYHMSEIFPQALVYSFRFNNSVTVVHQALIRLLRSARKVARSRTCTECSTIQDY